MIWYQPASKETVQLLTKPCEPGNLFPEVAGSTWCAVNANNWGLEYRLQLGFSA